MRELISHSFEDGNIPEAWLTQTSAHSYENSCLRSGRSTQIRLPLPGAGWHRLRVEVDVEPIEQAVIDCGSDTVIVALKVKEKDFTGHAIVKHGSSVVAQSPTRAPDKPGLRKVVFDFVRGRMSASVDGEELIRGEYAESSPYVGWLALNFWLDCLIHSVRILGDEPLASPLPEPTPRGDFYLDMAVDFYDDWWPDDSAVLIGERIRFSRAMYDEFFAQLKRCGVRRVAWNYHDRIDGEKAVITDENDIGDNFELAVAMAHKHGMQIFGTIKPFETAYFERYSKSQPGFLMARKPGAWGDGDSKKIQRIELVKADDRPCGFSVKDIAIHVSDDNKHYRPYTGPLECVECAEDYAVYEHTGSGTRRNGHTRRSRVMRLSGLEIDSKYVVASVPGRAGTFTNKLIDLIHLFGEKGEEHKLTYGMATDSEEPFVPRGGFERGVKFDLCVGTPTAHFGGLDAIREPFTLDSGQGFLAVARSKPQYLSFLGSPSYSEVREWWLSWVRAILEAGADGVEVRRTNHTSIFTWGEFGFEPPVRDEFLKRTGVDIWVTDDFDKAQWQRLRGEGYTEFCRAAREITRKAGKTLGLHVDSAMIVEPEEGAAMGLHWDWRTWIKEGLADYVLLKGVWPGTSFAREVQSLAGPKGIDVVVSLFEFSRQWREPGCESVLDGRLRAARDAGCDGYQFYDSAALLRGSTEKQRVVVKNPAVREVLRKYFAKA